MKEKKSRGGNESRKGGRKEGKRQRELGFERRKKMYRWRGEGNEEREGREEGGRKKGKREGELSIHPSGHFLSSLQSNSCGSNSLQVVLSKPFF